MIVKAGTFFFPQSSVAGNFTFCSLFCLFPNTWNSVAHACSGHVCLLLKIFSQFKFDAFVRT